MSKYILAVCAFLLTTPIYADSPPYLATDGYWYYQGFKEPYTRTLVTVPGCYVNNCYVASSSYYSYKQVQTYDPPKIDYTDQSAEAKLFDLAKTNVIKEAEFAKEKARQDYIRGLAKDLGVYRPGGAYPYSANYAGLYGNLLAYTPGSFNLSSNGLNGNTIYGYGSHQSAQLTGPAVDYSAIILGGMQQGAMLARESAGYGSKATTELNTLTDRASQYAKELEEIKLRTAERVAVIQASVVPTAKITSTTHDYRQMPKLVDPPQAPQSQLAQAFQGLGQAKCAACHVGEAKKGNFDLNSWPGYTIAQKMDIVQRRLTTNDPEKMMPRQADGKPGTRLTDEEIRLFLAN